jgi:hypothetical protein
VFNIDILLSQSQQDHLENLFTLKKTSKYKERFLEKICTEPFPCHQFSVTGPCPENI